MNDDERALLQAQATIFAGLLIADATRYGIHSEISVEKLLSRARYYSHRLAQNLDLESGKP